MWIKIAFITILVLAWGYFIFQVLLPSANGTPIHPFVNKRRKELDTKLAVANEEVELLGKEIQIKNVTQTINELKEKVNE